MEEEKNSLFPQGPLTAEVLKAVGEIGLIACAFEAKGGAEAGQHRFVHTRAIFDKEMPVKVY